MTTVERIRSSFLRHCRINPYATRCQRFTYHSFNRFSSLVTNAVQGNGAKLFPELVEETHCTRTLLSIDPDSNGAITAFTWNKIEDHIEYSPWDMLRSADIRVYDMPTETWQMRTREKKRPSSGALVELFRSFQVDDSLVRIAVESSTPTHLSGKFAWYDSGFSSGMLHGIFEALDIQSERVPVSSWKKGLGLVKLGKPGSLELARVLFEDYKDMYLTRKKDHGRAESMLIGAWALGVRPEDVDTWPDLSALLDD